LQAERKPVPFKLTFVPAVATRATADSKGTDMNLHTKIHTTTLPMFARPSRSVVARWIGPIALLAVAVTAVVGLSQLRASTDPPSKNPAAGVHNSSKVEPLLSPEEKAFIDRIHRGPIAPVAGSVALQASTFEPLVIPEEQAFIDGEYSHGSAENWCATHKPC
jgi:hypothetical protein